MKTVKFRTTWGMIALLLSDDGKVIALNLPPQKNTPPRKFFFRDITTDFQSLEKKFPTVGIPYGTTFQQAVWDELKKIPRGQTRTYGAIAAAIGHPKAVRAVGSACGANPLPVFIPCHRVIAAGGPGGFSSGLPWKKLLLELEGVRL